MHALDKLTEPLDYAMGVVRHLESVATYPELRAAYNAVQPEVSAFYSGIPLNDGLWKRIKAYAATARPRSSTGARRRFLHKTVDTFRRHGADLDAAGKKRLEEIDVELTQITTKFAENVLDSTNAFELVITDESRAGRAAAQRASPRRARAPQRKGLEGWRFTLQAPSYLAVMTYLDDARDPRARSTDAFSVRAAAGERDNRPLHRAHSGTAAREGRAARLRRFRRPGAGRSHGAHRRARAGVPGGPEGEDRAPLPARRTASCSSSAAAWKGRTRPSSSRGTSPTTPKSSAPRSTISTKRRCAPTSRWSAWWPGCSKSCSRLYGIRVEEEPGVPVWDPDVQYYDVRDEDGAFLGGFYADWYPRENKRGGAWMDALHHRRSGGRRLPSRTWA